MQTNSRPKRPDFLLCIPLVILVGFGMVMVYSASGAQSLALYGDSSVIFFKQLIALLVGTAALAVGIFVPHILYRRLPIIILALLVSGGLLIAVLFQAAANGAHRWFYFGNFGFQPSDLAKLVLVVFVATFASKTFSDAKPWRRRLLIILPVLATFCGLILLQPDFGTTMVIVFIVGMMLFLAGMPMRLLFLGGILLAPIVVGLVLSKGYRVQRIKDFFGGEGEHYQTQQATLALGSGGLTGVGLARGRQKLYYLPEPHTDFIFATLGEEMGFLGTATVLACYLLFLIRGVMVLYRVEAPFSKILGSGLLLLLTTQALINMSIAVALFPNKGLTLPFISAGGTSLILSLGMCGVLLNISRSQVVENRVLV